MIAFQEQGHRVFLLTQSPEGDLHNDVKPYGVRTFSFALPKKNPFLFYWKHVRHLSRFVKEHRIDIVYSHLQQANVVSVFAQRSCKARFIICRHHSDSAFVEHNKNAQRFDRIINRLGKEFIAPSQKVYRQMTEVEKVDPKKIHLIRYGYDFNEYAGPDKNTVAAIREKYPARLLLIKVARLIPEKRHMILLKVMCELVKKGCDIKLLLLSEGYLREELEGFVKKNRLENHVFFLGHRKNVIDHLAAADVVVHVSASEASNNLVKEAALVQRPVIACRDVGDFDEYLVNGKNSILLSKEKTGTELSDALEKIYSGQTDIRALGQELESTVRSLFSIEKVIEDYAALNK